MGSKLPKHREQIKANGKFSSIITCSMRSMAVLSEALLRGEAPRKIKTVPASISLRFLGPRPPILLSAPNQNRHATQANYLERCGGKLLFLCNLKTKMHHSLK